MSKFEIIDSGYWILLLRISNGVQDFFEAGCLSHGDYMMNFRGSEIRVPFFLDSR